MEYTKTLHSMLLDHHSIRGLTEVTDRNRRMIGTMKSHGLVETCYWTGETELVELTKKGLDVITEICR